jgi:hypothetical protein
VLNGALGRCILALAKGGWKSAFSEAGGGCAPMLNKSLLDALGCPDINMAPWSFTVLRLTAGTHAQLEEGHGARGRPYCLPLYISRYSLARSGRRTSCVTLCPCIAISILSQVTAGSHIREVTPICLLFWQMDAHKNLYPKSVFMGIHIQKDLAEFHEMRVILLDEIDPIWHKIWEEVVL